MIKSLVSILIRMCCASDSAFLDRNRVTSGAKGPTRRWPFGWCRRSARRRPALRSTCCGLKTYLQRGCVCPAPTLKIWAGLSVPNAKTAPIPSTIWIRLTGGPPVMVNSASAVTNFVYCAICHIEKWKAELLAAPRNLASLDLPGGQTH